MKNTMGLVLLVILGLAAFVVGNSIYTVDEVEQVIITQFGKPVAIRASLPNPVHRTAANSSDAATGGGLRPAGSQRRAVRMGDQADQS